MRLFLVLLLLSFEAWGATWYVRPVGSGGSGAGTSYANAFLGFAAVTWGVGNVNTGDTLKVCGSFVAADYDATNNAMLDVGVAGLTIDGNCTADGGAAVANMNGSSEKDNGVFCVDNTVCTSQTWKNISVSNFTFRGFYIRNALTASNTANFIGTDLSCTDIISLDANLPQCVAGFGSTATLTRINSSRTQDDSVHWEGNNFTITDSTLVYPAQGASGNLGDCVQVAVKSSNAQILRNTCDKTNSATKQCYIINLGSGDTGGIISDNTCYMPLTGNSTQQSKAIYSDVPQVKFLRNFISGGYYGIYMLGADQQSIGNILLRQELRGIDAVSTVSTGTSTIANNSIYNSVTCFSINGGASVTVNMYNNLAMGCATGYSKGGSATLTASDNAVYANTTDRNGVVAGAVSVTAAPGLIGGASPTTAEGFRLTSGSALRRVGKDLNIGNVQDYGNRAFSHPPSIGAREAASGDAAAERTLR